MSIRGIGVPEPLQPPDEPEGKGQAKGPLEPAPLAQGDETVLSQSTQEAAGSGIGNVGRVPASRSRRTGDSSGVVPASGEADYGQPTPWTEDAAPVVSSPPGDILSDYFEVISENLGKRGCPRDPRVIQQAFRQATKEWINLTGIQVPKRIAELLGVDLKIVEDATSDANRAMAGRVASVAPQMMRTPATALPPGFVEAASEHLGYGNCHRSPEEIRKAYDSVVGAALSDPTRMAAPDEMQGRMADALGIDPRTWKAAATWGARVAYERIEGDADKAQEPLIHRYAQALIDAGEFRKHETIREALRQIRQDQQGLWLEGRAPNAIEFQSQRMGELLGVDPKTMQAVTQSVYETPLEKSGSPQDAQLDPALASQIDGVLQGITQYVTGSSGDVPPSHRGWKYVLDTLDLRGTSDGIEMKFVQPAGVSLLKFIDEVNRTSQAIYGRDAIFRESFLTDDGMDTAPTHDVVHIVTPVVEDSAGKTREEQAEHLQAKGMSLAERPVVAVAAGLFRLVKGFPQGGGVGVDGDDGDLLQYGWVRTRTGALYSSVLGVYAAALHDNADDFVAAAGSPIGM